MINIMHLIFLYNEININPTRVTVPPIKILDVILSLKELKNRIILTSDNWENLSKKLIDNKIQFIIKPSTRFKGEKDNNSLYS